MYGQFLVLFALIFTGYLLRKLNVINQGMTEGLHSFITWFAFPCLLVYTFGSLELTPGLTGNLFLVMGLSFVSFFLFILISRLLTGLLKYPPSVAVVAELGMSAPNNGFMGFPIALLFFGQHGLILMMGHNIALNVYMFTYGISRLRKSKQDGERLSPREGVKALIKLLLNPNILAMFLGFAICYLQLPLDNPVGTYMKYLSDLATPLAMMFIGATLAGSNVLELLKNRVVWESSLVKLLVMPGIIALAVGFLPIDPIMKGVLVIGAAMPTGALVSLLSMQEGQDGYMASKIIFFSTVLSMGTIPLWLNVLYHFFPV